GRSRTVTACPRRSASSTRLEPMKPAPPATRILVIQSPTALAALAARSPRRRNLRPAATTFQRPPIGMVIYALRSFAQRQRLFGCSRTRVRARAQHRDASPACEGDPPRRVNRSCLDAYRARFGDQTDGCRFFYHLADGTSLPGVADASISFCYSWDSMV